MELNVLTFNIRCCNDPNGHSIEERAPRVGQTVRDLDPDLIGFQEATARWETHFSDLFGDRYDWYLVRRSPKDTESCPLFWRKDRFECLKQGTFWLSDTPDVPSMGWDDKYHCFRICSWVVLRERATDRCFTFMSTHYGFGDEGQCASDDLIAAKAAELGLPALVVGDFNMRPNTPGYAHMCELFTDANVGRDLRTTYHGYSPDTVTETHIDYCFLSEGITSRGQERIDRTFDGKFPSDHFPLRFDLTL